MDVRRILLAEDDNHQIELTLTVLDEPQLVGRIDVVRDGVQALDYLYRRGNFSERPAENPAVCLLDLKMPKLDGLEVLRAVKGDANLRTMPIVVFTSSREERDLVASYRLGVNAYVVKPVNFEEFVSVVKQLGAFWGVVNEPPPPEAAL